MMNPADFLTRFLTALYLFCATGLAFGGSGSYEAPLPVQLSTDPDLCAYVPCKDVLPKGRNAAEQFIDNARLAMAEVDRLSAIDSQKLIQLLERLVNTCLDTPPPPDTWSIRLSYQLMPDIDPPFPYFEQAVSCLAAYRDDAHLEAWRRTGLTAIALEVLTYLWRDQAGSLDDLVEKLAHRGHSKEVYTGALAELRERKLITGTVSAIHITAAGKSFREEIEADTNRLFFAPWSCLSPTEKSDLEGLLVRVRDSLREPVSQ